MDAKMMFPVKHALLTLVWLGLCCVTAPAAAQERVELEDVAPMRDSDRIFFGAGFAMFSGQPGSVEDLGGLVMVGRPLWYSPAWGGIFQLSTRVWGTLGMGQSRTLYGSALLGVGFELFLGRYISIDNYIGLHAGFQSGDRVVPLAGLGGMGGWGLHPFDDVRQVLRFGLTMAMGIPLIANDVENDCQGCPSLGITLGYESPF